MTQKRNFEHDAFGLLRKEEVPERQDAGARLVTKYNTYDALSNLLSKTDGPPPSVNLVTTHIYDPAGRLLETDAGGNKYVVHCYDGATTCDGIAGLMGGGTYKVGRRTTTVGWNYIPRIAAQVVDDYDFSASSGRVLTQKTTVGNGDFTTTETQTFSYSPLGIVNGGTRSKPSDITAFVNFNTSVNFSSGLPTSLQNGQFTIVSAVTHNPSAGLASWSSNSVTTTITQDTSLMPRPRQISTSNGGFDTQTYSYDGAGNIKCMGSCTTGDSYSYDARSRLTNVNLSGVQGGGSRAYTYDAFGNLTTLDGQTFTVDKNSNHITSSSLTSTWAYDALGNLTQTGAEVLGYDALNRQTRQTGGTDFTYLYNGEGERIVKCPAGSVLRREMARYIAEANVKAGKTGWSLTACTVKPFTDVEITDPDCQHIKLIAAKGISSGCGGGNFCPETALNRASMAVMLVKGYQPDGDPTPACTNHFTDAGCSDPTWGPYAPWIEELWRDGVTSGCGVNLYCPSLIAGEWEMLIFLSKAPTTPPGGYYWAAYHPVPRGSTYTFRDEQNRVIREATAVATGTASATPLTVRDNIFLENTLVESYASPTPGATPAWEYYTPDHLGTPRYVRFSTGGSATHKYWPYGAEATTPGAQRLGLATMERDMEANHFYDHARTEDFGLGRFTSPDKVGGKYEQPQTWNRYAYARNNPLKYLDPDGQSAEAANFYFVPPEQAAAIRASVSLSISSNPLIPLSGAVAKGVDFLLSTVLPQNSGELAANLQSSAMGLVGVVGGEAAGLMKLLMPEGRAIGEAGSSASIRVVKGGAGEAEKLFGELAKGGKVVENGKYPGTLVELPDGSRVGLRPASKSGPPTIDVNSPNVNSVKKIKFVDDRVDN